MNTYLFTSTGFTGHILFVFDTAGQLLKYDTTEAELSQQQQAWITQRLPKTIDELKAVLKKSKGATLTLQLKTSVTFLMFWDKYDEKARSSKKKAQTTWNRLSQLQRDAAYNHIDVYFRNIPNGVAVKYAETYLNAELWNN